MGDIKALCPICPQRCELSDGELGFCQGRRAVGGRVIDENYGRITALALDPIEKKPLARFHSGSWVLSVGSYGCNLRCPFCQNARIACADATKVAWQEITPDALVSQALEMRDQGNIGLAYTYNEPLIGFEFVRDCAKLAHEAGLGNVVVTNGVINPGPLRELIPLIDAWNIDLKGFTEEVYESLDGSLEWVKRTIRTVAEAPSCHLEVTTLIVPGLNDDPAEIDAAASWLASVDPSIVYHLSRFFPCHRMAQSDPTPVATVKALAEVARRSLADVLTGNC